MSRYHSSGSKGQHIQLIAYDHYRLSWVVDRYYAGSRLRHPTVYSRDTDRAGAERFAKRWEIAMPEAKPTV